MKKLADLLVSPGFIRCHVICLPVDVHNIGNFGLFLLQTCLISCIFLGYFNLKHLNVGI